MSRLETGRPRLVIGVGGYASGPAVLAARLAGVKTMILEQNHYPGATNRWLAPRVDVVCGPSEAARERLDGVGVVTGNPVRDDFRSIGPAPDDADPAPGSPNPANKEAIPMPVIDVHTHEPRHRLDIVVGIAYENDAEEATTEIVDAMSQVEGVADDPGVVVVVTDGEVVVVVGAAVVVVVGTVVVEDPPATVVVVVVLGAVPGPKPTETGAGGLRTSAAPPELYQ